MKDKNARKRILVCSLGSIGKRHVRTLQNISENIKIAVLRSRKGSHTTEQEYAEHVFYDIKTAIEWCPDAAIIASPANIHLEQSLIIANHSIPILIEKPIGIDYYDKRWGDLIRLSENNIIDIAYILRHDPLVDIIKHNLKVCTIGKLISADFYCGSWLPDWRPSQDYKKSVSAVRELGGGVVLELSHEINLAQYILGKLDLKYAMISNSNTLDIEKSVEDTATLLLTTKKNHPINIRLDFCTNPEKRRVTLRGHKGEIQYDILKRELTIHMRGKKPQVQQSYIPFSELYVLQMRTFLESIDNKYSPKCSVVEALETLRIACESKTFELYQQ